MQLLIAAGPKPSSVSASNSLSGLLLVISGIVDLGHLAASSEGAYRKESLSILAPAARTAAAAGGSGVASPPASRSRSGPASAGQARRTSGPAPPRRPRAFSPRRRRPPPAPARRGASPRSRTRRPRRGRCHLRHHCGHRRRPSAARRGTPALRRGGCRGPWPPHRASRSHATRATAPWSRAPAAVHHMCSRIFPFANLRCFTVAGRRLAPPSSSPSWDAAEMRGLPPPAPSEPAASPASAPPTGAARGRVWSPAARAALPARDGRRRPVNVHRRRTRARGKGAARCGGGGGRRRRPPGRATRMAPVAPAAGVPAFRRLRAGGRPPEMAPGGTASAAGPAGPWLETAHKAPSPKGAWPWTSCPGGAASRTRESAGGRRYRSSARG